NAAVVLYFQSSPRGPRRLRRRPTVLDFFFQAEDGIRGLIVTGVQTCALPISRREGGRRLPDGAGGARRADAAGKGGRQGGCFRRSEERRVGKECRCGWGAKDYNKKDGMEIRRMMSNARTEGAGWVATAAVTCR